MIYFLDRPSYCHLYAHSSPHSDGDIFYVHDPMESQYSGPHKVRWRGHPRHMKASTTFTFFGPENWKMILIGLYLWLSTHGLFGPYYAVSFRNALSLSITRTATWTTLKYAVKINFMNDSFFCHVRTIWNGETRMEKKPSRPDQKHENSNKRKLAAPWEIPLLTTATSSVYFSKMTIEKNKTNLIHLIWQNKSGWKNEHNYWVCVCLFHDFSPLCAAH